MDKAASTQGAAQEPVCRVGQNHTCIGTYGVHTAFLAMKSPYRRSYTVQVYGSGQAYLFASDLLIGHCTAPLYI